MHTPRRQQGRCMESYDAEVAESAESYRQRTGRAGPLPRPVSTPPFRPVKGCTPGPAEAPRHAESPLRGSARLSRPGRAQAAPRRPHPEPGSASRDSAARPIAGGAAPDVPGCGAARARRGARRPGSAAGRMWCARPPSALRRQRTDGIAEPAEPATAGAVCPCRPGSGRMRRGAGQRIKPVRKRNFSAGAAGPVSGAPCAPQPSFKLRTASC